MKKARTVSDNTLKLNEMTADGALKEICNDKEDCPK